METRLKTACPVCKEIVSISRKPWLFRCETCGFLRATLQPAILDEKSRAAIDEGHREVALNCLRIANFEDILDRLTNLVEPQGRRLLDVGCAHGWFLRAAQLRGFDVSGLEPDPDISKQAMKEGYKVWTGFFPGDVPADEKFDVIVFNDVFEHLPDVDRALEACREILNDKGLLVLNIPSSAGFFYRMADVLDRAGICGPLERLWQKGFASPHLSYFSPEQLARFVKAGGFAEVHRSALRSVAASGLWERLRYDRNVSVAKAVFTWLCVVTILPVLRLMPADISLQIFEKQSS